jgi:hypothetical protein
MMRSAIWHVIHPALDLEHAWRPLDDQTPTQ